MMHFEIKSGTPHLPTVRNKRGKKKAEITVGNKKPTLTNQNTPQLKSIAQVTSNTGGWLPSPNNSVLPFLPVADTTATPNYRFASPATSVEIVPPPPPVLQKQTVTIPPPSNITTKAVEAVTPDNLKAIENSILNQINTFRASKNLPPLSTDPQLTQLANKHSQTQAATGTMSHEGFDTRFKQSGFSTMAENVAFNKGSQDPATTATEGWIKSPGHLKNLTGDYTKTGISVEKAADGSYYFTQLFGN